MAKIAIDIKEGKVKKESNLIVGIDLGTTNSLIAVIEEGEPRVIKDENHNTGLVPSIVYFDEDNKIIVGEEAKQHLVTDPGRTIFSVKRLMGKTHSDLSTIHDFISYEIIESDEEELVKIKIGDKYYTPVELSAEILKALKLKAEKILGQIVEKVVITVPAYFNDTQRQATRDAGKLAGLNVLRVVNEPTAASLAYGLGRHNEEKQQVAVYDLGGGTFDISILTIDDGVFEVLSTNGNTFLGGDDFDKKIFDYWIAQYALQNLTVEDIQKLRLLSEQAKRELSSNENYITRLELSTGEYEIELSKIEFENLIDSLVQETIRCCALALEDSGLNKSEIDQVIMVGGSTRVPLVNSMVSAFFGKAVNISMDPDEVVAIGAAVQADILAGNNSDMLLLDITPLSLGIETIGGLMDVIIPRNSKIPTKIGRRYTTSIDGQKNLKIAVYQGERDLVEDNRKLGEFILNDIPPMAAGIPQIEIQFLIDADGILIVRAKELRSNTETKIQIKSQYGISEEEMARMLLDSITNAEKDMKLRSFLEAKNEANNILLSADKFKEQNSSWLSKEQIDKITKFQKLLKDSFETSDPNDIRSNMDKLNEYTTPLAHEALDRHIGDALKGKEI